ncbi:MAG: phage holin [Vagococcus salmoninarum]|uniref:phage holin n=1 Tax=Vagococcus salmoninarum TaxID=2739 RepID=UPI003F9991C7
MENKTYDILKWVAIVVLPAVATFVGTIGVAVNWQYTELAIIVLTAVNTMLGSLLGVSTRYYNKEDE